MIKICHMTSAHCSNDIRIFCKECVSLSNAGYETYLVASGKNSEKFGVHIVGIGSSYTSRLKRMIITANLVYKKALELECDIYHFHDPELLPYGLKLFKKGKKVIFDSHEDYYEQIKEKKWIPSIFRNTIARLYKSYETRVVKEIDAVIFPCLVLEKNLFEKRAKRTVLINNVPIIDDDIKPIKVPGDKLCYIGSISKNRGVTSAIQGAAKSKVKIIIAGKISYEYRCELERSTEYEFVDYRGYINHDDIYEIFNECFAGLCLLNDVGQYYHGGNLATKVYEYLFAGLPVILNNSPYNIKFIDQYKCGICVNPQDINEITCAINYLSDNPELARIMGKNGRKVVLEKYNWNIEEKKLIELYQSLQ